MRMRFCASDDGRVSGDSMNQRFAPFDFVLREAETLASGEQSWEEFVFNRPIPAPHWSNYVKGAVCFAQWKYGQRIKCGFHFLIDSTIPPNSGASSSSALVVLAGAAIREVNQIEYSLAELAQDSAQAEWFLGTRGGTLDHTAICLAKQGQAVHLSYAENRAELVPLPGDPFRWVTFFSHSADKGREVMLEYNERVAVSRLLIPAVLEVAEVGNVIEALPETMTLAEVARHQPLVFAECQRAFPALVSERFNHPLKLRDRARHHVGEVRRVAAAVALLRTVEDEGQGEDMMRALGRLLDESHENLRELYEVCTPQVDQLMDVIRSHTGVYGARLMGGGFGGSLLALTTAENVPSLIARVQAGFYAPQGRNGFEEGAVMVSTPGDGLSLLKK